MAREFTRKELYDLVWSAPLRTLAKELNISDVGLAKICRGANIPLPGLGHWAKRAVGKPTRQFALPARGLGQHDRVNVGGRRASQIWTSDQEAARIPTPAPPSFTEGLAEVTTRAREMIGYVPKGTSIKQPHQLIAKLLEEDEQRRQAVFKPSWHWDKPIFDNPIQQRRLRLINRLFLAFSRCECRPAVMGKDGGSFSVSVGDQRVGFTLDPPGTERTNDYRGLTHKSKDHRRMQLKVSWYQPPTDIPVSWIDSDNKPLEEQLTDIAVGVLVAGEWLYRHTLIRHHDWLVERKHELAEKARQQEEERQRKEREKILKLERRRREKLLGEAAAWNTAAEIRRYVQAVLENPSLSNAATSLMEWATWALAEADRMDPLRQPVERLLATPGESSGEI